MIISESPRELRVRSATYSMATAVVILALSACSAPGAENSPDPFPERPYTLDIARIDPCSALTSAQAQQRGAETGGPKDVDLGLGGRSTACGWNNFDDGYGYNFQTIGVDARQALSAPGTTRVETVNGFGAAMNVVDESTGYAGPGIPLTCQLTIDVNQGQAVRVQVQSSNTKSFNNKQAEAETCDRAKSLAGDVLTTLTNQQR